ncbi:type VI secretion system-associated protein TagF [Undibacterium sp. Jales W-56]|uniref:type VI secretion system-associated protein TagF n=1 Tax=Undibacterium sp. Jales W-56 TaxID=2897325 RepID=UPI0021D11BB7|nr:type VI secretion system-associated protein TagF [Undibacterium sp. Jales W-56]MCU6432919.1 type VI secretion system-associated protein TagF [Undibacterium sp. Jales W-56]
MTKNATQTAISYFGKIPTRGDFVKATDSPALISVIDDWLAQAMELLSSDPRWKITYDTVVPMHFAFIGPRRKRAIAGHIVASTDEAQRRFPFMAMSTMEIEDPSEFVQRHPLVLARLWKNMQTLVGDVLVSENPGSSLQKLSATNIDLELSPTAYEAAFTDFLNVQTVGALDAMLLQTGFTGSVREVMLALGFLLEPVMSSGSSRLEKSLVIPLPADPIYRYLAASFWMNLIAPFLLKVDFELAVFFTQIQQKPSMIVGFSGASPRTLQAIMDAQVGLSHHIPFENVQWVDEQIHANFKIQKLSSYLNQPHLSLKSARDSFREAFIGA